MNFLAGTRFVSASDLFLKKIKTTEFGLGPFFFLPLKIRGKVFLSLIFWDERALYKWSVWVIVELREPGIFSHVTLSREKI